MSDADRRFWNTTGYHDLAEAYERGIELSHPPGAECVCGSHCPFAATRIKYYDEPGGVV